MNHIPTTTPTEYNGRQFRSYLEACWAATLDFLGILWDYEEHKVFLSDGQEYWPDFYLRESSSWLEVKGPHMNRIDKVEKFAAHLWATSPASCTYDMGAPMVILGKEPHPYLNNMTKYMNGISEPKWWSNDPDINHLTISCLGIMGPGKAHSMVFSDCDRCGRVSPLSFWQPWCRSCHQNYGEPKERYEFVRL